MNKAFAELRRMVPGLAPVQEGAGPAAAAATAGGGGGGGGGEFKLEVLERTVEHVKELRERLFGSDAPTKDELEGRRGQVAEEKGVVCARCASTVGSSSAAKKDASRSSGRGKRRVTHRLEPDSASSSSETGVAGDGSGSNGSDDENEIRTAASSYPSTPDIGREPSLKRKRGSTARTSDRRALLASTLQHAANAPGTPMSSYASPTAAPMLLSNLTASPDRRSARADSQATEPDPTLPLPGTVHPSFPHQPGEVLASLQQPNRHPSPVSSSTDNLPLSRFFHPNMHHQPSAEALADTALVAHSAAAMTSSDEAALQGASSNGQSNSSSNYRNPNLYLPPPFPSAMSPVSPFFRPELSHRGPPPEPSPLLPPLNASETLFDGLLGSSAGQSGSASYRMTPQLLADTPAIGATTSHSRPDSLLSLHKRSWTRSGSDESDEHKQPKLATATHRSGSASGTPGAIVPKRVSPALSQHGQDEEAAANVLLALSSPEVMTPWQPPQNSSAQDSRLERWSLDSGSAAGLASGRASYSPPVVDERNSKTSPQATADRPSVDVRLASSKTAKTARDILDMRLGTGYQGVSLRLG